MILIFLISTTNGTASVKAPPIFFEKDHYTVNLERLNWNKLEVKKNKQIKVVLESPSKSSTFTLRESTTEKNKSLKQYVYSWLKDYNTYGLKITDKKPVKMNEKTYGYKVTSVHESSGKMFVQYISIAGDKLVTLTCQSHRVDNELKACAESLSSFSWKKSF